MYASCRGMLGRVLRLLARGARVNAKLSLGDTALILALTLTLKGVLMSMQHRHLMAALPLLPPVHLGTWGSSASWLPGAPGWTTGQRTALLLF